MGAALLMTEVWGWQGEGGSLGPTISLAFLLEALGNYTFLSECFPETQGNRSASLTLASPCSHCFSQIQSS